MVMVVAGTLAQGRLAFQQFRAQPSRQDVAAATSTLIANDLCSVVGRVCLGLCFLSKL
jgi:hypothetical protein